MTTITMSNARTSRTTAAPGINGVNRFPVGSTGLPGALRETTVDQDPCALQSYPKRGLIASRQAYRGADVSSSAGLPEAG